MPRLSHSRPARWAAGDGGLYDADGNGLDEAAALEAMPEVGLHVVEVGGSEYEVERVGSRYCSVADVRARAAVDNDDFGDPGKYPDNDILDAIQAAEEAIDGGCGRSFCRRAVVVPLPAGASLVELPVVDAVSIGPGRLVSDRQAANDSAEDVEARVEYGARCTERIRRAARTLAASYLRPRSGAENARGASVDGVYVSYELATGEDGSWTGIPSVDAAIAEHRSRRAVIG